MNRYRALTWIYRCFLPLFSPQFQQEFADEMEEVFKERLELAEANGRLSLLAFILRELFGLIMGGIRQRVYGWQAQPLLAARTGGNVALLTDHRWLWRKTLLLAALVILIGLLLFLAYWVYVFFFFSFGRPAQVHEVALGDLNGDGHLDAYLNIGSGGGEPYVRPDYILFNDGSGRFSNSQEFPDSWPGSGIVLGDLTGNGLADILLDIDGGHLVLHTTQSSNNSQLTSSFSAGNFLSGTEPGPRGVMRMKPELGDLNGDGHLDVFAAGCCGRSSALRPEGGDHLLPYSLVWLNDGHGRLVSNGQIIGQMGSNAVALADLNGDGSLDAFLANGRTLDTAGQSRINTPNSVWFNDGEGNFTDSGQQLGNEESYAVALGDLNGDGFIDAVVGNRNLDEIWFNDGQGNLNDSGQRLGSSLTRAVFLADLDGDGALDLVVAAEESAQVWLNDGAGQFSQGQRISYNQYEAIALGDVTGDGIVDIFVAGVEVYQVWRGVGDGRFSAEPRTSYQ